jgi:predicted CoA-binding protein
MLSQTTLDARKRSPSMSSNLDPRVIGDEAIDRPALRAMLEARSVAVVGASPRAGSFGERVRIELERSPSRPRIHLINPRYSEIAGHDCVPSLEDLPEPIDLVVFAVCRLELFLERVVAGRAAAIAAR